MDNASNSNPNRSGSIPLEGSAGESARPTEAAAGTPPNVSRAPLNLGGTAGAPAAPTAPKPAMPRPVAAKPPVAVAAGKPSAAVAASERITGCKTFFTKMHPGAIHFLDEQIAKWLAENPQVIIKHTNVIQGEITEKKIEQNIVIVVWY